MQTELTPKAAAAAQRNPLKLAGWSLHFYRLPYSREVVWSNAIEREGSFALLKLTADSGAVGIAEGTLKSTWSGVSPRSLAATLEDLVIPRIAAIDLGDPAAVTAALKSLARRAAVPVDLSLDLGTQRFEEPVEVTAYYLTSEALTNTAKHAHASRAQISARRHDGWLELTISDDGRGGAQASGGSGLAGLVDRVEAIGGTIQIDSPADRGTAIKVKLPINSRRT